MVQNNEEDCFINKLPTCAAACGRRALSSVRKISNIKKTEIIPVLMGTGNNISYIATTKVIPPQESSPGRIAGTIKVMA